MLGDAFEPAVDVAERLFIRDVKDDYDALSLLVEALRQGSEPLLSRCVPYFYLGLLRKSGEHYGFARKVQSKCCHVGSSEFLLSVHLDH